MSGIGFVGNYTLIREFKQFDFFAVTVPVNGLQVCHSKFDESFRIEAMT